MHDDATLLRDYDSGNEAAFTTLVHRHLLIEDGVRAKADALLGRLSASARASYASPEQLIAAVTTKSIPLDDAQVVWQHQPSDDEAFACVFVKNPGNPTTAATPHVDPRGPKDPPCGPAKSASRTTYLSLRRTDAGWKLVVPLNAIDRVAQEIGLPK